MVKLHVFIKKSLNSGSRKNYAACECKVLGLDASGGSFCLWSLSICKLRNSYSFYSFLRHVGRLKALHCLQHAYNTYISSLRCNCSQISDCTASARNLHWSRKEFLHPTTQSSNVQLTQYFLWHFMGLPFSDTSEQDHCLRKDIKSSEMV